jgi:hypothetical protein
LIHCALSPADKQQIQLFCFGNFGVARQNFLQNTEKSEINNGLSIEAYMGRSAGNLIVFIFLCFASQTAMAGEPGMVHDSNSLYASALDPEQVDSRQAADQSGGFFYRGFADQRTPMTGNEKWHFYLNSAYGPRSFFYNLAGAGIQQARNAVPEWGQGMEGYSKRFGSVFGQKTIAKSVQFGLGSLLHEDPRYFASRHSGIVKRSLYAVGQGFISYKDSGGARFAYSRLAGTAAGAIISRQWHPEADRTAGQYIGAIASSIALEAVKNLAYEFWPRKKS